MYSFKFYYVEACENLKIKQNEKLLSRIEDTNTANLNLSSIELTEDTCKAIGHALKKDVFLQELDLSNCMLSDDGLSNILAGLAANKFLLTINLKGNNIRSAGTVTIGKLLRHNNHLQNLYLEWNAIGILPEKFSYLCEGLGVNTCLKSLDLRNNQLNHLCAQSLSDVIYRNSTLQYLDLRWNSIGLIGGRAILQTLSKNKSIVKLDISGNDIPLEIQKSIEFITSVNAERFLKSSEDMKKTRLFASKFQQLEGEKDKQLKLLKDQLEQKDKVIESTERSKEFQRRINLMIQEKNDLVLTLNEMEIKNKESREEFSLLIDKEKKEKEDIKRKLVEELGILKEENLHLKQKIQQLEITKDALDDEIINLKSIITKIEKKSKLEEKSYQDQITILNESHEESIKEMEQLRKNDIMGLKEEFAEIEKNLKERITHLENRKKDLERQIIEKDDLITENKLQAEKTLDELKKKMKYDEDKLKKQLEEKIEMLESANKKQDELLKDHLEAFYKIQKKSTENNLLLSEELHRTQQLEHMLQAKDDEMEASIAKVKLEVRGQIDKLHQESDSLKLKVEEMEKQHKEEIQSKDEEIKNFETKIEQLKTKFKETLQNENKKIDEFQTAFASYVKSVKKVTDKEITLEDGFNANI